MVKAIDHMFMELYQQYNGNGNNSNSTYVYTRKEIKPLYLVMKSSFNDFEKIVMLIVTCLGKFTEILEKKDS